MRFKMWGAVAAAAATSGCITTPNSEFSAGIKPAVIHSRLACEIALALEGASTAYPYLKKWRASYTITLKTEKEVGAGLTTLDWVIPSGGETYRLGVGFSARDKKLDTTIIKGRTDRTQAASCSGSENKDDGFRGDLGLDQWFASVAGEREPVSLGKTIEFTITIDGGVRPGFLITNLSGSAGASGNRKRVHTLDIALADGTPPPPQRVIVVQPERPEAAPPRARPAAPAESDVRRELMLQQLLLERKVLEE